MATPVFATTVDKHNSRDRTEGRMQLWAAVFCQAENVITKWQVIIQQDWELLMSK